MDKKKMMIEAMKKRLAKKKQGMKVEPPARGDVEPQEYTV